MFKLKITLDRHNARIRLNNWVLLSPLIFRYYQPSNQDYLLSVCVNQLATAGVDPGVTEEAGRRLETK
jgi:hypothetical protein